MPTSSLIRSILLVASVLSLALPSFAAPPPGRGAGNPLAGRGNGHGRPPDILPPPPAPADPPSCTAVTTDGELLVANLSSPLPGTLLSAYEPDCPTSIAVEGTAGVGRTRFDMVFVLDSSGSSAACSGADIDEDGEVGFPFGFPACSDPGDTVLAAEVRAVRDFVATLSPLVSRVAIIQFSMPEGTGFLGERQRIVVSLTDDFAQVDAGLDEIMLFGSAGATDYGGALALVLDELATNGDPVLRRPLVYFMSDGIPTYPDGTFGTEEPGDSEWALDHADMAAAEGIRIDTFGVGFIPSTTQDPVIPRRCLVTGPSGTFEVSTLECVALRTGGEFFASNDLADIVDRLQLSLPSGIESVTVLNETTGVETPAPHSPDGRWVAPEVELEEGVRNDLLVTVTAEDGTTCLLHTNVTVLCHLSGCSPRTQGYWHRQCMGLGMIPTTSGRRPPPHPDWDPATLMQLMFEITDPLVAALGSPTDLTTCQGLDADPADDKCQKAIKQYTAVLMNIHGGRLGPTCELDLPGLGIVTPDVAAAAIADLIAAGLAGDAAACQLANDLADLINTGAAVR